MTPALRTSRLAAVAEAQASGARLYSGRKAGQRTAVEFLIPDLAAREQVPIYLGYRTRRRKEEEGGRHGAQAGLENQEKTKRGKGKEVLRNFRA